MLSDSPLRMSFEVKRIFLMNSQYTNQHNQSTVETVTAVSNMFFKQKSEIKHMHTMGVVVVKICVCFLNDYVPDNTIKIISSRSMSLLELFLDRRRTPKIKSTVTSTSAGNSQLHFLSSVREGMAIY